LQEAKNLVQEDFFSSLRLIAIKYIKRLIVNHYIFYKKVMCRKMAYKKPQGYKTPHEIFKLHKKDMKKHEVSFIKDKGPFKEVKLNSSLKQKEKNKIEKLISDKAHSFLIHNHPISSAYKKTHYLPSSADIIKAYFKYLENPKSTNVILVTDKGKEIGRIHFRLSDKTIEVLNNYLNNNKQYLRDKKISEKSAKQIYLTYFINNLAIYNPEELKKVSSFYGIKKKYRLITTIKSNPEQLKIFLYKLNIQFRFVSMPGYKFNKEKMIFEKR
jgi:hypothetical protein